MPVEGLRYHQKETSIKNRASFPGQKVPPDRLVIKSVATAPLMSFLKDPVPLAVLGSSLLCFFLVSFFPHPTEMQSHSVPPLGVKTHSSSWLSRGITCFPSLWERCPKWSLWSGDDPGASLPGCRLLLLVGMPWQPCPEQMITGHLFGAGYHAVHGVSKDFSYLAAGFYSPQPFRFHRPVKWIQQIFIQWVILVPGTGEITGHEADKSRAHIWEAWDRWVFTLLLALQERNPSCEYHFYPFLLRRKWLLKPGTEWKDILLKDRLFKWLY